MIIEEEDEKTLHVTPEDADDVWALHEVLQPGDLLRAKTVRKVHTEDAEGETRDVQRVTTFLKVSMERIAGVDLSIGMLRVAGKIVEQTSVARMGQYHTLEIGPGENVTITREDGLHSVFVQLRKASLRVRPGTVCLLAVDAAGGHSQRGVCELRRSIETGAFSLAVLRMSESASTSTKAMKGSSAAEKATARLVERAADLASEGTQLHSLAAIVVACGDREVATQVQERITRTPGADKTLKTRIVSLPIAVSSVDALISAIDANPQHMSRICSVAQQAERTALDEFHRLADAGRTAFGPRHVRAAAEMGAVALLMLADEKHRCTDVAQRRDVDALVAMCEEAGGRVVVFARGTPPSEELERMSGVAAVLHFPVDLDSL